MVGCFICGKGKNWVKRKKFSTYPKANALIFPHKKIFSKGSKWALFHFPQIFPTQVFETPFYQGASPFSTFPQKKCGKLPYPVDNLWKVGGLLGSGQWLVGENRKKTA